MYVRGYGTTTFGGRWCQRYQHRYPRIGHDPAVFLITVMISTVSVLMAAHAVEVFVWALAYLIVGVVPGKAGFVYFAFVNYTTLGYGDILPVERWRLLGPITALNGVLLIGWSTAVIFEVLRRALARTETPK